MMRKWHHLLKIAVDFLTFTFRNSYVYNFPLTIKKMKNYSNRSFWQKIKNFAAAAGRKVTLPALAMYYCMKDKDTPLRAKLIIIGALGYFILPADMICDLSPLVGFTDDLTVLVTAYELIRKHVKDEHIQKAQEQVEAFLKPAIGRG